jgi:hypothetical protein
MGRVAKIDVSLSIFISEEEQSAGKFLNGA